MIVRKIREEEYPRTQELFSLAFEIPLNRESLTDLEIERVKAFPRTREERYWLERWAAFTEEGDMMSFLIGFPATVRFDGGEGVCTCIGGVSSLPQYRGRGAIAGCFQKHLEDSYQAGHLFSYLYPFSTRFYKQFGYASCTEKVTWELNIDEFPEYREIKGECILSENFSELDAIEQVYAQSMKGYNLSFVREEWDWNVRIAKDPAAQHRYTYLWRNKAGIPKGVLTFRKEYEKGLDRATMICEEFFFVGEEGLKGLLKHIRSYRGHFQKVKLTLPKEVHLEQVLPEVSGGCRRTLEFAGMGRVIHVEKALKAASYRGTGKLSFKLNDPWIPENNGVFEVSFEDGKCTQIRPGTSWEKEFDIGNFSRLLLGACWEDEMKEAPYNQVFYKKKLYISDSF